MAAKAIRALGNGKTFIYMPGTFQRNTLGGELKNRRSPTYRETRYTCFAPITRGAMGIISWRLNRCTQAYRDNVVYPSVRELSKFKDFYLGTWHDELVSSNRDTATVDYLKKFVSRDELLTDVALGKTEIVRDFVPDASYCLRKKDDGTYMLLVVNNRREAQDINLTIDLSMPATVNEALEDRSVAVKNNVIADKFAPFGVHVYLFKSAK